MADQDRNQQPNVDQQSQRSQDQAGQRAQPGQQALEGERGRQAAREPSRETDQQGQSRGDGSSVDQEKTAKRAIRKRTPGSVAESPFSRFRLRKGWHSMYDAKKAQIEAMGKRFELQVQASSPEAQAAAQEYLEALTDFVETFNKGPGADPRLLGLDTTGELARIEEQAAWAEEERRRVRKVLQQIR